MEAVHPNPTLSYDLKEAESLISNILQFSTEYSIIGQDLDGNILLWNEGAHRIYGYEAEEVVGKANFSILHSPAEMEADKLQEIMAGVLRSGKWEGVIGQIRKNEEWFPARVVITPRRDAASRPIGFLLISKDISDEIRLTEELKASQFYTRSLIESNIDALTVTDQFGIITDINRQMVALTGFSRGDLIGSAFKQYFTDPRRAAEGIARVLRDEKVTDYELTVQSRDGQETVVSYNMTRFFDWEGNLRGVFAAARDVTERKVFEQTLQEKNAELEKANRAKDSFLAGMSHELRTPLNAILGFTGTLLMQLPGPLNDDQKKQLTIIKSSAKHLLSLINDLLDVAKIESGKVKLTFEPVAVNSVLDEVATALRPLAEDKGLVFKVQPLKREAQIQTDHRALNQILLNLVSNAIKFTDHGSVCLEVERARQNGTKLTRFRVTDTGVGIRPDDQTRLFQAFSQLDRSGHREEGTGLGLHLSQMLAGLLGGHIYCESEYGKGSIFTLTIKDS